MPHLDYSRASKSCLGLPSSHKSRLVTTEHPSSPDSQLAVSQPIPHGRWRQGLRIPFNMNADSDAK